MIHLILTIIYISFIVIIGIMLIWNMFESKKIYEKIIAAIMLVLILLRIFLIK